jgi:hypothetical protein
VPLNCAGQKALGILTAVSASANTPKYAGYKSQNDWYASFYEYYWCRTILMSNRLGVEYDREFHVHCWDLEMMILFIAYRFKAIHAVGSGEVEPYNVICKSLIVVFCGIHHIRREIARTGIQR